MREVVSPPTTLNSLAKLREAHQALLDAATKSDQALRAIDTATIGSFLSAAVAAGRNLVDAGQRRAAQDMINYWAAEYVTRKTDGESWSLPRLADPTTELKESTVADDQSKRLDLKTALAAGRIAAGARQWQASGRSEGWLLNGQALKYAEKIAGDDADIKAFVDASRVVEQRHSRKIIGALSLVIVLLIALVASLAIAWNKTDTAHKAETGARLKAEEAEAAANEEAKKLAAANADLSAKQAEATRRVNENQRLLDQIAPIVRKAVAEGAIALNDVPEALLPLLEPPAASALDGSLARGYDPAFLRPTASSSNSATPIVIGLPSLSDSAREDAWDKGNPLDSINYSVVFDRKRHMPVFSAVNLQRSEIVPLLRPAASFRSDPRVPAGLQLPDNWRGWREGIDRGHLANASEIAWGDAFKDRGTAGAVAYGATNVMTNITPQYDTFNGGLWLGAERYARENFSPGSERITIFSGPVFGRGDRILDGIAIPTFFWKVLVALAPGTSSGIVVEAYLVSQLGSNNAKVAASERFSAEKYRNRVTDIERLTGLDFGDVVRGADTGWFTGMIKQATAVATRGDELVKLLPQIASEQRDVRQPTMQLLYDAVRSKSFDPADLRKVAGAAVAMASGETFKQLSFEGKFNVLSLLATIPSKSWSEPSWIDLRAAARRAVGDAPAALEGCVPAGYAQPCGELAKLRDVLGWRLSKDRLVFIHFAGFVRSAIQEDSEKLRQLGWTLRDEERIAAAAGLNDVRYGSGDDARAAAELLAADLRVLGRRNVRAKHMEIINPGTLEVWIGL